MDGAGANLAACPRCRRPSPWYCLAADYNRRLTEENFYYYRCPQCGIVFLSPVPADLGRHYPGDYYGIPGSAEQLAANAELERYKIDLVRRFVPGGRLLEIGPAYGAFAYLASKAGFETLTIEMNEQCCRFMNDVLGVRAIHSHDTAAALRQVEPCDVIALWHVIEHLPDAWSMLEQIVRKLAPGGVLVIAAPNPEAFQFGVMGRYWTHLDAPRHLQLIPAATLSEHAIGLGLNPLLVTTTDTGSMDWNGFGWRMTLANATQSPLLKRVMHRIGKTVGRALSFIEGGEGRGSAYTAIYRKPGPA